MTPPRRWQRGLRHRAQLRSRHTGLRLADGSTKPISQIQQGDRVAGVDQTTGGNTAGTVSWGHEHADTALSDVTVRIADGGESAIRTTPRPTPSGASIRTGGWTPTTCVPGTLRTEDGRTGVVIAVRSYTGLRQMYDLTVDEVHTYYVVAGTAAVLVHNVDCLGRKVNWLSTARLGTLAMNYRRSLPLSPRGTSPSPR